MDANLNYSKLLDTDGCPGGIATSSGRMLLTEERLDYTQGRLDRHLGSDFFELESVENLPGTFEIAYFMLVTLNLS